MDTNNFLMPDIDPSLETVESVEVAGSEEPEETVESLKPFEIVEASKGAMVEVRAGQGQLDHEVQNLEDAEKKLFDIQLREYQDKQKVFMLNYMLKTGSTGTEVRAMRKDMESEFYLSKYDFDETGERLPPERGRTVPLPEFEIAGVSDVRPEIKAIKEDKERVYLQISVEQRNVFMLEHKRRQGTSEDKIDKLLRVMESEFYRPDIDFSPEGNPLPPDIPEIAEDTLAGY